MDIFDQKGLHPMLLHEEKAPFDAPEFLYELKFDGIRCLAYVDKGHVFLQNKRNLDLLPIFPELGDMHSSVKGRCIFDGELIVMDKGKPNFEILRRRSLMGNKARIDLISAQHPASYVAFDILYVDGKEIAGVPLIQRKGILTERVEENGRIAVSRYIEGRGGEMFAYTVQNDLEGIVAKRKDSLYAFGKRSKDWIKIKNMKDEDLVACGYLLKEHGMISLILGSFRDQELLIEGHVTLGVTMEKIKHCGTTTMCPFKSKPEDNDCAVWFHPLQVCTVSYMERTSSGGMRQPVFKGLRDDKHPESCVRLS